MALDFDLACTARLLQFENKRDYKQLESLIKSLAVMVAGMFGQKIEPELNEPNDDLDGDGPEIDDDDPDVW